MLSGTVLTTRAMAAVDRTAIAGGIPGIVLMEAAGRSVTRAIVDRFAPCAVLVLAGPGNNGGDGYVVARRLAAAGWPVRLAAFGDPARLSGDAALAAARWSGPIHPFDQAPALPGEIVVDALFGAGLDRPLEPGLAATLERATAGRRHIVAVDVPSGACGSTGAVSPGTPRAAVTVTFCRAKPGHLLLPARGFMGEIVCADIGIPDAAVAAHDAGLRVNTPAEWRARLPERSAAAHKYSFGHALIIGGGATATGACSMAALAAARIGAGLVTVAAPAEALGTYAGHGASLMTRPLDAPADLDRLLADSRFNAVLFGPAAGLGQRTEALLARLLACGRKLVLDADALTALGRMRPAADGYGPRLPATTVLTPHDGEFARLSAVTGDRLTRARAAAEALGCTVLLKGADTVIAAPDGRARLNPLAPGNLATAGTGDVLAGMIVGLLAQGVEPFDAAAAAAWLHGRAAQACPTPMLATDLLQQLPLALEAARAGRAWDDADSSWGGALA
jgi:ADP-dependent NAD(P)H-hydrate dehydratase / NAD(P)H-hydrate epimerase